MGEMLNEFCFLLAKKSRNVGFILVSNHFLVLVDVIFLTVSHSVLTDSLRVYLLTQPAASELRDRGPVSVYLSSYFQINNKAPCFLCFRRNERC